MANENPYQSPAAEEQPSPDAEPAIEVSPETAAHNLWSDTVYGMNYRLRDNLMQGAFIMGAVVVLAVAGSIYTVLFDGADMPWYAGALAGGFVGLVIGFFTSGLFLMIYRAWRHARGKHD